MIPEFLDRAVTRHLYSIPGPGFDFASPAGEEALTRPDSVSWQVFKNPVALFIGGVAAVVMEFADPAVRSGVWDHSSFRTDPVTRLRRTGLAAMATVYGAGSSTRALIAGVVRMHDKVSGTTPSGQPYRANDTDLLSWVQATAVYGFAKAFDTFARPLGQEGFDRLFAEALPAARLYGADGAPVSEAAFEAMLARRKSRFEPSPVILEFLDIMNTTPALPAPLRPLQRMLVRAAVDIVPAEIRGACELDDRFRLGRAERAIVATLTRFADRVALKNGPPAQACRRLGLPDDYLYR